MLASSNRLEGRKTVKGVLCSQGVMSGRESAFRPNVGSKENPKPPPSRTVGHSQVYLLLILVLGFLLVFSYQSEIYSVLAGRERYNTRGLGNVNVSSSSKAMTQAFRSDAKVETGTSRSRVEKEVFAEHGGADPGATQRKLDSLSQPTNSSAKESPPPAPPAKNKWDKRWKDKKVEAYMPLVESVDSNILSGKFQFLIKLLALNDYGSLVRCLSSLSEAEYAGDSVDIHIYIDHFEISEEGVGSQRRLLAEEEEKKVETDANPIIEGATKEKTSNKTKRKKKSSKSPSSSIKLEGPDSAEEPPRMPDRVKTGADPVKKSDWGLVEQKLKDARRVLHYAESFQWKHGKKVIHYRTRTAGSQSQWLDAWYPASDDEFAIFLEDDAELSPLYYRYARSLIATYYYQYSHSDPSLYGISLQRPQIVPGKNGHPIKVDDRTRLFKYQMVGVWGQIFFPRPWKEFRIWYDNKKSHDVKPVVDGMVTTDWYKQFGEKMFTPWFVKFAYNQGYFNLYTNFLQDRVLSVTHRGGVVKSKKYAGCDSVLIWNNGTYDLDLWHMAGSGNIKKYDYCFSEVRTGRFANYSHDASWVVGSAQENKKVLVISTIGVPEHLVRNWLCKLRKLGIQNYLLVGEDPVLLEDLARRGHATMRIESKGNFEEYVEKEASAVSDVLGLGYDVWFTRADTIWMGNPLGLVNTGGADVIGVENSQLNLFFIRSTQETTRLWGSLNQELSKVPVNVSRTANWDRAREKFLKSCVEEKVKTGTLPQVVFIDGETLVEPPTLESNGGSTDAQVLLLSGLRSATNYEIKKKVSQLKSWNLDDDLGCAELICL